MAVRSPVESSTAVATPRRTEPRSQTPSPDVLQRLGALPLRVFLGLTFIYAALDKIADPGYLDPGAGGAFLGNQLQQFIASSPIGFLIQAVALPQIQLVGIAIIVTELVVGVFVLTGVLTRLAAVVGAMLSLTLFLSLSWNIHPYFLAPDSIYAVAWITMALVGDGGAFGLQAYVQARRPANGWARSNVSEAFARAQAIALVIGAAAVGLIWLLAILPKGG
jgi:thiosulfate dehydrogenase [quinone] large subunit